MLLFSLNKSGTHPCELLSFKMQCWCYRCTSVLDLFNAWFHSCSGFGLVLLACSTKHTLRVVLMHTFTIHYCPTYSAVPLNFCTIPLCTLHKCVIIRFDIYLESLEQFLTFCSFKIWRCCFSYTLTAAESLVSGRLHLNAIACRHSQLWMFLGCLATGG